LNAKTGPPPFPRTWGRGGGVFPEEREEGGGCQYGFALPPLQLPGKNHTGRMGNGFGGKGGWGKGLAKKVPI